MSGKQPASDQLRVRTDRGPTSATPFRRALGVLYVVALVNERPDFVRVLAGPGRPGPGADGRPLTEKLKDFGTGLSVQLIHGWLTDLLLLRGN